MEGQEREKKAGFFPKLKEKLSARQKGMRLKTALFLLLLGILFGIFMPKIIAFGLFPKSNLTIDSTGSRLGFEDIGELSTQSAYTTEVSLIKDFRTIFGLEIPFTQSKYIYSYDVQMKAGLDFSKITWKVDNDKNIIDVSLPPAKILSNELVIDSFKVYHEEESLFQRINLEENNKNISNMLENAQKTALKNGFLENAQKNAEKILEPYFARAYDLEKYKLQFSHEKS